MPRRRRDGARAFRVGMIYEGVVVEEQVVEAPRPVTVGTEPGASLSADLDDLPDQIRLLDWEDGECVLRAPSEACGRLQTSEGIERLEELRSRGSGGPDPPPLGLSDVEAGRVEVGEVVILFQRAVPPADAERPEFPAALKRGPFAAADGRLAAAVAATALLQVGFVVWTQFTHWPPENQPGPVVPPSEIMEVAERSPPADLEPKEDQVAENDAPKSGASEADSTEERDEVASEESNAEAGEPEDSGAAEERGLSESEVREGTVLEALGAKGGDDVVSGAVASAPTGAFDEAIADASRSASDGGELLETGGRDASGTADRTVGTSSLDHAPGSRDAERGVSTSDPQGADVECRNCPREPESDDSDDTSRAPGVGEVFRRNMGRIQGCYERELKRNPELSGKIVVSLRIGAGGSPSDVRAVRDTVGGRVAGCVVGIVRHLDFPGTGGGSTSVVKTFVFEPGK